MRGHLRARGFTLIELIASITIIAIIAAVVWPRTTTAQPFLEGGYADGVAVALRHARTVAVASGCEVQFTIDAAGYRAFMRGVSAVVPNHCATAGPWVTPVPRGDGVALSAPRPAGVTLGANRQFVFATDGAVAAGPLAIVIAGRNITVDPSGLVQGP
jgi:MSHA pilin protein MshC